MALVSERASSLQALVQFILGHGGYGHEVDGGLVALVVGVLDHLQRGGDLADVGGHAHHIDHALILGQDVLVVIRALGVGHDRELKLGRVVAHDAAEVLLAAVLPGAVFARHDDLLRGLVAQLHVVNPRRHAGVIDRLNHLVVELVVVHQAAVADGAIQDFDLRAVGYPAPGGRLFGFGCFSRFGFGGHRARVFNGRFSFSL